MPQPRKRLVSTQVTPLYHVVARCVRWHFLCSIDPLTGKDYSARKRDIKDRIALLADVFAIDVCAYAILSNHYHLVLHIDELTALERSDMEVAERWNRVFTGPFLVRARESCLSDLFGSIGRVAPSSKAERALSPSNYRQSCSV